MSTPILATKLFIPPPRPRAILRPHLLERLNEGLYRKLTLISAPAGFGKTTLVSSWLGELRQNYPKSLVVNGGWVEGAGEEKGMKPKPDLSEVEVAKINHQIAWLSLDNGDNDLTRFLIYLVAALQTLTLSGDEGMAVHTGDRVLALLQSPQPPPAETILTLLLNDITTIPDNFILVLDDYHVIDNQTVDHALSFLLQHLPSRMHLVITTREDPQLPLGRLRARGELTELRAADLRFTLAEATGFLNQVMGLGLSAQNVMALETRTEGWIAGLQLAALALQGTISIQGHEDATRFIQSFSGSHHFVMDYLVEEVLRQQPESIQTFLLHTSLLDRLCGPLCDVVLLDPAASGSETLAYLERANLLVFPLDDNRYWYRYHHLFADVLQARLMKEQPDLVASLHLRACLWYEQNDFHAEAIRHALVAGAFERAADLIELARSGMLGQYFRSVTWLEWVKALPDECVRTRPRLTIGYAWELLFSGEMEAAATRLQDADRLLEPAEGTNAPLTIPSTSKVVINEEEIQSLRASSAIAWAYYAQALGDVTGTVRHAHRALTLVSTEDYYTHGFASSLLGLACLTKGDLEVAYTYLVEARTNLRLAGNILFATSVTYILADIRVAQGRLREAIATYEQALQLVLAQGKPVLQGTANLYLGLGELYHEQGNETAAREHLLLSEELGKQAWLDDWPYSLYLVQAQVKQSQGDLDGALELLDAAERLYYRSPVPDIRPVAAMKAQVWIRQGRLPKTRGWAQERGLSVDDPLIYPHEFEYITLARLLLAHYQSDRSEHAFREVVGLLERLRKAAEEGGRWGSVIEILMLQALAHQAQGNITFGLRVLEQALTLAEPEGYIRIFVDEGTPVAELLTKMRAKGGSRPAYLHRLLDVFAGQNNDQPFGSAQANPSALISQHLLAEPLSQRELDVLQLIAQGLSNHEIGERLYLALNTVKGHNRRIFAKLQVERRTEAIARGRELGLL